MTRKNTKYNCLICLNEFIGLQTLKEHLAKHINFKACHPFPCSSCALSFTSKEERNAHCANYRHLNTFETNENASKEMLLEHLLFDAEQAKHMMRDRLVNEKNIIFFSALDQLKKSTGKVSNCILCNENVQDDEDLLLHIRQHLQYKAYSCECKMKFHSVNERIQHTLTTGHSKAKDSENSYCEMLVTHFFHESRSVDTEEDIRRCKARAMEKFRQRIHELKATKVHNAQMRRSDSQGAEQGPRRQGIPENLNNAASHDTSHPPEDNRNRSSENERQESPGHRIKTEMSDQQNDSSSALSSSIPFTPALNLRSNDVSNVQVVRLQNISSSGNRNEPSFPTTSELRTTSDPESKCQRCNKMVASDFFQRQKHVAEMHMGHDHSDRDYKDFLEAEIRKAFPGQTFSIRQCQLENCGKSYCSDRNARIKHIVRYHCDDLPRVECTLCNQRYSDVSCLDRHWNTDHHGGKNVDTAYRNLHYKRRRLYKDQLNKLLYQAYPDEAMDCEAPTPTSSVVKAVNTTPALVRRQSRSGSENDMDVVVIETEATDNSLSSSNVIVAPRLSEVRVNTSYSSSDDDDIIVATSTSMAPSRHAPNDLPVNVSFTPPSENCSFSGRCSKRTLISINVSEICLSSDEDDDVIYIDAGPSARMVSKKSRLSTGMTSNCKFY